MLLTTKISQKKQHNNVMASYVEVVSLVTSDEGAVELVERRPKEIEVISLVTSEEGETSEGSTTDYDSDEEYWRQRKKRCPFILWSVMKR